MKEDLKLKSLLIGMQAIFVCLGSLSFAVSALAAGKDADCGSYSHCSGWHAEKAYGYANQTCCLPKSGTYSLGGVSQTVSVACAKGWYMTIGQCNPATEFICCTQSAPDLASSIPPVAPADKLIVPKLNVAIPGLVFSDDYYEEEGNIYVPILGQYISAFFNYTLGLGLVAAAIMMVWGAVLYIYGATGLAVSDAKKKMTDALIGLIIILGSYVILVNLNVNLTRPTTLKVGTVKYKNFELVPGKQYAEAVRQAKPEFASSTLDKVPPDVEANFKYIEKMAKEMKISPCVAKGIARTETQGNQNAINHNENFGTVAAQERVDFLRKGQKYTGASFVANMPAECSLTLPNGQPNPDRPKCDQLAAREDYMNDDSKFGDPSKVDGGFDWAYTHDFGIGAINIATRKGGSWCNPKTPSRQIGNVCYTWFDLLTLKGGVQAMLTHPALKMGNPDAMARNYVGMDCGPGCGPYDVKFKLFQGCMGK